MPPYAPLYFLRLLPLGANAILTVGREQNLNFLDFYHPRLQQPY